jgi:hypothetical protein
MVTNAEMLEISKDEKSFINVMFDSQILGTFMSCPREMDLKFNRHLRPIASGSKAHDKGTLTHEGLRAYYEGMRIGQDYVVRVGGALQACRKMAPTLLTLDSEDILDVYNTLEQYFDHKKNEVIHVVFTERLFTHVAYEVFPLRIIVTGRIDLGILEGTQLVPVDHKSEAESWFYSALSNQFKIYALACDSTRLYVNRVGFQKSKKPADKFKVETITFDSDALEEFKNEVLPYYAKQMLIAAEDNYYPPNYASCIKGHFGCVFSDKYRGGICNASRAVREEKLNLYFKQEEWDPSRDETKVD